jgi:hypothetical protein
MPKRQVYKETLIPGSPGGKIMSRCWLACGVLLLVKISPVCGELGCGQPALASDTGPTGTEASPAGPLTAPHAGQVASHSWASKFTVRLDRSDHPPADESVFACQSGGLAGTGREFAVVGRSVAPVAATSRIRTEGSPACQSSRLHRWSLARLARRCRNRRGTGAFVEVGSAATLAKLSRLIARATRREHQCRTGE